MANSFGDQFLKAGLVNKTALSKAEKEKGKQQKLKQKQKVEVVDPAVLAARQAAAEKAARDLELNRQYKADAERRAILAQVRQLVELNRLPHGDGDVGYHFQDGTAVKKLFVTREVHDRLTRGLLAIARLDDGYAVIPAVVAEKIKLREPACIVGTTTTPRDVAEDDPYADYKVPDDLMW